MSGFFTEGFLAAVLAGLVTGVGGFLTFSSLLYSKDDINLMLNIAAGVMLAASFFVDGAGTGRIAELVAEPYGNGDLVFGGVVRRYVFDCGAQCFLAA